MAGAIRLSPCQTCGCEECPISEPELNDLTGLTTVSGSPSASGGTLTLDVNEAVSFTATAGNDGDATQVVATVDTAAGTATLRLKIAETDADNYLFGEFAIAAGAGTIRAGKRVGGTDSYSTNAETILDTSTDLTDPHELALCWEPGAEQTPEELGFFWPPESVLSATGWMDSDNVLLEDGSVSLYDLGASSLSNGLRVNFILPPLPAGATIDGIKVAFDGSSSGPSDDVEVSCTLSIDAFSETKGPLDFTVLGPFSFGADDDNWGYTGAAEDLNAAINGIDIELIFDNNHATDPTQLAVDWIGIGIYYTTADREAGVLRFTIKNNADDSYQCVRSRHYATGLKGGAKAQVATWTLTDFAYYYAASATRPTCPACTCVTDDGESCPCCSDPPPFDEYLLDFDTGGWVDDECTVCDTINGEYVLSSNGPCIWQYVENISCTCDQDSVSGLVIFLYLIEDGGGCLWRAGVGFNSLGPPESECEVSFAIYEAALTADTDCQDMPVTLTKVLERSDTGASDVCDGNLPATITLDVP